MAECVDVNPDCVAAVVGRDPAVVPVSDPIAQDTLGHAGAMDVVNFVFLVGFVPLHREIDRVAFARESSHHIADAAEEG